MIRSLPLAALALAAALLAPPALAQGVTTAALEGRVLETATGEGLPGATVVAVHEPSGTRYGAATRTDGRYDLRGLRVGGPYTVTASFVGFRSASETDVTLVLGQAETVNFSLSEESAELTAIEVVAESDAAISRSRTGASTNVTEEAIESLPSISRSLADFARLSPLSGGGGSYSLAGRNNRYNNIQIDGATLNDVFGLAGSGTPGGQAGTQPVSLDAVEEFNVDIAPYDVRYNGFTGGSINAVTKSGTNNFNGTLRVLGRNESLVGDFLGEPFGDFSETQYIGTIGGPIIRDRLFFFLSGELSRNEFPEDTGILGSNAPTVFPVEGSTLDEIATISNEVYGYNPGGFDLITDERDSNKLLVKLDYNLDNNNRISLRHNFVDANDDQGVGRGTRSFDLANRRYVFNSQQNSTALQLNSTLGSNLVNEARLVYTTVRDSRDVADQPFSQTSINLTDDTAVNIGIDRFSQANGLDQNLFEFTNNATYFAGDHTILFGTSNQLFRFDNLFIQDFYGSYEFDPLSDVDLGDGNGAQTLSALDAYRLGLPSRYQFSYASEYQFDEQGRLRFDENGNPVRSVSVGGVPRAEFTGFQVGLYAQDEWDVTDDLRLTAGLRLDVPLFPDTPVENPLVSGGTGVNPDGSTFEIAPAFGSEFSTSNTASGNLLWSPRLGFNYQTPGLGGESLQFRGGTGIFSGRTPYVWISNQYSNTGADLARLDVRLGADDFDVNGNGIIDLEEQGFFPGSGNPEDQPIPGDNAALLPVQTTEINLIAEDFKLPQVWRTNIGIDQELPLGIVATLEGLYSKSLNEVVFRNLNIEQTATSAYGRPLYERGVNPNFTNALLLENSNEGYEYSIVTQLQRRVRSGLGGSLSYTFNRAENVNNATSSRAISNWQFNENVDINAPGLGTADFEVRHRVLAYASYRQEYLDRFSTELGFVLDTQAGEPYSWIYSGDANGDGQRFNDLLYVPAAEDDVFLTSENWNLLDSFIDGIPGLDDYRGDFTPRNASRAPWQTRLDVELNQGVTTLRGQRIDFELTLINLLNFLNDDWGRIRFTNFNNITGLGFERYIEETDIGNVVAGRVVTADDLGKPVVNFSESTFTRAFTGDQFGTASLSSRWQLRFGVKYTF